MRIKNIHALEILDSRGNPTIKTTVELDTGGSNWSAVPSGASTGKYEALELRDGDAKRYYGKGVLKAVSYVNGIIRKSLLQQEATDQEIIDKVLLDLDSSNNKSGLGANALLSVSQAVCKTVAGALKIPLYKYIAKIFGLKNNRFLLPRPMVNIFNGGKHALDSTDIQEYMIVPVSAKTFSEGLRMCTETFQQLKKLLHENGLSTGVGDEGGFMPKVASNEEAILLICQAIKDAGYSAGKDISIALDCAASEFYKDGNYYLKKDNKILNSSQLVSYYEQWVEKYPIISIEDYCDQDDWQGFCALTKKMGKRIQTIGDDLYVTNINRLKEGIRLKATNAAIIKPNQIGTVTETLAAVRLAQDHNVRTIISNRSGETEDDFIADLAVGTNSGQIKTGSVCRGERTVKYNRLLQIEAELGENVSFGRIF